MNWNDAETSASKQFTMPVDQVLDECGHALRVLDPVTYGRPRTIAVSHVSGYNPLRSLTIMRAVHLLEEGERGAYADLQWTYRFIEMQDATLGALVERRTSAIQELDWNIKLRAKIPAGKEQVAAKQQAALERGYQKIGNLSAAFEAMQMASFRGFTRLEKVLDGDGDIVELAPVDQWFWVRQGLYGAWQLNKDSTIGAAVGEPVPEERFVSREVSRPINRVALIAFVRKSLSQKDWDGFIETYGIPAVFIVMPDNVPEGKEDEYLEMADQVTGDARGVLPGGSDVKTVDNGARGVNPFKDHIYYQDEQVVLRGTGGKLTMLAESGSGTLAGNAHSDTFAAIARAEAAEISEIFRKCIDAEIIQRATPGEDAYAYFELAANEETDPAQVVKDLVMLEGAGLETDQKWIEEKTGYPVRRKVGQPGMPIPPGAVKDAPIPILNRNAVDGSQWKIFPRETGTLEIPRSIMPQIQSVNRAAMVNKLRKHGADYDKASIKPADLKPTQAEYCPAKVQRAREHSGPQRALLISSDNHVVDGHHQYLAALQDDPNTPIPVFRIKAPIMHVLGIILQMRSTAQERTPILNREQGAADDNTAKQSLRKALASDLQPLGDALFSAMHAGDEAAMRAALKKISQDMPDFLASAELEDVLGKEFLTALIGDTDKS
ncbi:MAG: DUF935 family protein [Luteolibacter sp.]|nr:DUF935 family protein [Luteolibacter sp.]